MESFIRFSASRRFFFTALFLVATSLPVEATAQDTTATDDTPSGNYEVIWRADNATIQALPESVRSFTLDLYNKGLLPVRAAEPPASDPRASVIFQREYPYLNWDDTTASLFCDLNDDQCERPRTAMSPSNAGEEQEHLLGLPVSSGIEAEWSIETVAAQSQESQQGEVYRISVPALTFFQNVNWRPFTVSGGAAAASEVYDRQALGCSGLDQIGAPFGFEGQYPALIDMLANAPASCPLDIFHRNYGHFQYLIFGASLKSALTSKTTTPVAIRKKVEGRMHDFEQRLMGAREPWAELDAIVEEIRQDSGLKELPIVLPVFSLEARLDAPQVLFAHMPEFTSSVSAFAEGDSEISAADSATTVGLALDALTAARSDVIVHEIDAEGAQGGLLVQDNHDQQDELKALTPDLLTLHLLEMSLKDLKLSQHKVLARQREKLFDHINYPWHGGIEFAAGFPRLIVVVDEGFSNGMSHCIFAERPEDVACDLHSPILTAETASDARLANVRDAVAGYHRLNADGKRDYDSHGHAVASVAAAHPSSGTMLGIDPGAFAVPLEVELRNAGQTLGSGRVSQKADEVRQLLRQRHYYDRSLPWAGVVWSLSFHLEEFYQQAPVIGIREYAGAIRREAPSAGTLEYFVFAAGNVPKSITEEDAQEFSVCRVFPACFAADDPTGTMIAVVGAQVGEEGVAELWTDGDVSSYAYPNFQVAAIAKDVPISLAETNAFTIDSGTSYAAPQVAALVAALRAAGVNEPTLLMGRLMACARMTGPLVQRVRGGLIDVDCTLTLDRAQLSFDSGDPRYLKLRPGQLIQVWNESDDVQDPDGFKPGGLPKISGQLNLDFPLLQPHKDKASLAGFRTFTDDPQQINIVGWDTRPTTDPLGARGQAEVLTENRPRLQSNVLLEFMFDGEAEPVCARLYQVTEFVPEDTQFAEDLHRTDGPRCADIPPHRDFGGEQ